MTWLDLEVGKLILIALVYIAALLTTVAIRCVR